MSEQLQVPLHSFGRGEGGYLAISPDGTRLYIAWEDRLWALASDTLSVVGQLQMPSATDGLAVSVDGHELYLLPSTSGDLQLREQGMWAVDAARLNIVRHMTDWPAWGLPFFFAVPAAQ